MKMKTKKRTIIMILAIAAVCSLSISQVKAKYGPKAPKGKEKNWVQTIPGQGWWVYLRFYAPTKAYFDKSWSIGDFEKVK
jgi:hypothetical protein